MSDSFRPVFGEPSIHGGFTLHTNDNRCQQVDDVPPPHRRRPVPIVAAGFRMRSTDGSSVLAYQALPHLPADDGQLRAGDADARTGVVLLPDIRGAHAYYRRLAEQFASAGSPAVLVDWYTRTADTDDRGDDFEWQPHFARVKDADIDADVAAAVARLAVEGVTDVVTVGFCFGGAQSWRLGAELHGLAGAVGFYGPPRFVGDAVDRISCPVLMLLAGDDVATTPEEFDRFERRLVGHNDRVTRVDYEGVPHSFFDGADERWAAAAADAWCRVLEFVAAAGAAAPAPEVATAADRDGTTGG